jgi:GNAT superfamily N-acetyltransferase
MAGSPADAGPRRLWQDHRMQLHSLAERPELRETLRTLPHQWPTFMLESPVAARLFNPLIDRYPELQLIMSDPEHGPIAKVHAVPIAWDGPDALPDAGWDAAMEHAMLLTEETPAISLLEAQIDPAFSGRGLSRDLLQAAKQYLIGLGYQHLVLPLRPSQKSEEPWTPIGEYVARTRPDGLPEDGWLRVHARLGGRIVKVCPLSMIIPGTSEQWRSWTGLPFDRSGRIEVGGALVPVHADIEQDQIVYVEPNVWVYHPLDQDPAKGRDVQQ